MVLIQNYIAQNTFYITSLTNEQMIDLRATTATEMSRSDSGHWIAEPSAIRALSEHAKNHNHLFNEMVAK